MSDRAAPVTTPSAIEVVGRERELELILAAVEAGRDLILEGPPGTSKTTLLRAITGSWGIPLKMVEGNAELTPARLIGHHDPARVLREGYSAETFEPGPLPQAMQEGAFLYFEEFNRAPEDTLNVLLTAIADRELIIPRVGKIQAAPTFRLVGSMNPFDNVGTTRLSVSIKDRLCRLEIGYQPVAAEEEIVALRGAASTSQKALVGDVVALTRATREHDEATQGSSVRGAIDLFLLSARLLDRRGIEVGAEGYADALLDAMLIALSGRMEVDPSSGRDAAAVLREIWDWHFVLSGRIAAPGSVEVDLDDPDALASGRRGEGGGRTRPKPKMLVEPPDLITGPEGAGLATGGASDPGRHSRASASGSRRGFTDDAGELDSDEPPPAHAGPEVRAAAREIAARLASRRISYRPTRRGSGELTSVRFDGGGSDIDLDRTMEAIAERRPLRAEDVYVRDRRQRRRAVVLAVDASGSMRGERLRTAAATVGALSADLARDKLAVIAFWSDAALLLDFDEQSAPDRLVDEMLGLRASGLTNVSFPLELAEHRLRLADLPERRVLLLSDCVHNAGPDPCIAAARLPRLDVLFDHSGENDRELARQIATRGRGEVLPIRSHRDVAPALNRILAEGRLH